MENKVEKSLGVAEPVSQVQLNAINKFAGTAYSMNELTEDASKSVAPDAGAGSIGYNVNPNSMTGFTTPLRVEALDSQVKTLTFGAEQFVFFNQIAKRPASSSVEQYITYDRHGEIGHSMASREGELSKITSQTYNRRTVNMKYLTTARQVTVQATLANAVANPLEAATDDAVVSLAAEIEWMSFYGDKSMHSEADQDGLEFDGLVKLIDKDNVIDLRGKALKEDDLNTAAVAISKAYGYPTDAFIPMGAKARLVNELLPTQRVFMTASAQSNTIGFDAPKFQSVAGVISLNGSNTMENYRILDEKDPFVQGIKPSAVASVNSVAKDGQFSDLDRDLQYKVVAVSGREHSEAVDVAAAITNNADHVELEISIPAKYDAPVEFIRVYRMSVESGLFYEIGRVSANTAVDGKVKFIDSNEDVPGAVDVFVGQMTPDVIALYEWLPITRFGLATMTAAYTWSFLWFGALALFAPRKWVRLKNVASVEIAPQR